MNFDATIVCGLECVRLQVQYHLHYSFFVMINHRVFRSCVSLGQVNILTLSFCLLIAYNFIDRFFYIKQLEVLFKFVGFYLRKIKDILHQMCHYAGRTFSVFSTFFQFINYFINLIYRLIIKLTLFQNKLNLFQFILVLDVLSINRVQRVSQLFTNGSIGDTQQSIVGLFFGVGIVVCYVNYLD